MKKTTRVSVASILIAAATIAGHAETGDQIKERFAKADADGNGVVTHAEMMEQVRARFSEFDKNSDGFLELGELPKLMPIPEHRKERMEKRIAKMKEKMAKRGKDIPEELETMPQPTRIRFVAKFDKDGDERVSLNEFARKATRHFKRGDLNGDGSVTMAEIEEAMKKQMKKRFKDKKRRWRG